MRNSRQAVPGGEPGFISGKRCEVNQRRCRDAEKTGKIFSPKNHQKHFCFPYNFELTKADAPGILLDPNLLFGSLATHAAGFGAESLIRLQQPICPPIPARVQRIHWTIRLFLRRSGPLTAMAA